MLPALSAVTGNVICHYGYWLSFSAFTEKANTSLKTGFDLLSCLKGVRGNPVKASKSACAS